LCGIVAIFAYRDSAPPVEQEELLRIREAMFKRGPDGAGLWISCDQRIGAWQSSTCPMKVLSQWPTPCLKSSSDETKYGRCAATKLAGRYFRGGKNWFLDTDSRMVDAESKPHPENKALRAWARLSVPQGIVAG
jgi:hypothetical protein